LERNILVIAGEPSGDFQASLLISEFFKFFPDVHFWGFGGEKMRNAGAEILVDVSHLAVMGLFDVVAHIPKLKRFMRELCAEVERRKPTGAILVDYPGFNLSLAQKLKKQKIPVGYYISPQFWAWGENRVRKVKKFIDRMVCILPFEKEFYARHHIDVEYVGHPFVDVVSPEVSEAEFRRETEIGDADFIAVLPGSREKEIFRILPPMLEIFKILRERHRSLMAVVAAAPGREKIIENLAISEGIKIVSGRTYSAMKYARAGMIASGSATLEAMISRLPSVVLYRVDPLSWKIGRMLIKSPHIALANLVAGGKIFPEFIQNLNIEKIADEMEKIMYDNFRRNNITAQMESAVAKLGKGGASQKAAGIFSELFFGG